MADTFTWGFSWNHCLLHHFGTLPFATYSYEPLLWSIDMHEPHKQCFWGMLEKKCFAYLDDILVVSKYLPSHFTHVQLVLNKLFYAGLKVNILNLSFLKHKLNSVDTWWILKVSERWKIKWKLLKSFHAYFSGYCTFLSSPLRLLQIFCERLYFSSDSHQSTLEEKLQLKKIVSRDTNLR